MRDKKQYMLRCPRVIIRGVRKRHKTALVEISIWYNLACMRDIEQYTLRYLCGIRGDG